MSRVLYGSLVRSKETGLEYRVRDLWKYANEMLLTPNRDTLWDFEAVKEDFWDEPFGYEIWHEYTWQPITSIADENKVLEPPEPLGKEVREFLKEVEIC